MRHNISSLNSERSFQQLIENNADGIIVLSKKGVILYVNKAAEELLNCSSGQLMGQDLGVPLIPGRTTEIDLVRRAEQGVAELRVVETTWGDDQVYLASMRDITERKRIQSTQQFLSQASGLLAACLEPAATVTTVGRLAVAHLADWCIIDLIEDEDFIRRHVAEQGDTDVAGRLSELEGCYLRTQSQHYGPLHALQTGKNEVHAQITPELLQELALESEHVPAIEDLGCRSIMIVPLRGSGRDLSDHQSTQQMEAAPVNGAPLGVITFINSKAGRGYTAHEQTLAEDLARRAALALENARLYEKSREGVHRRDQFLAMLGHELRNPLAPILTAAHTVRMRKHTLSPEVEKSITVIERQAKHLIRLVDDLLDLSRVSRGRIQLRRQIVNMQVVVDDAVQASRSWIEARKQKLMLHRESAPMMVKGDPTRLAQVLVNLLNNASRYTPEKGKIDLFVEELAEHVEIRVRDSGVGIPPEMLRRIFDPFVQVHSTLDRTEGGMGIGLALVQRLIQLHGGRVRAGSRGEGKGSELCIRLPLLHDVEAPGAVRERKTSAGKGSLRILLVEDNEDAREMLRDLLQMWGHEVLEAANGREGIGMILDHIPDIALVDIGLPEVNGYEVVRQVREVTTDISTVLVALTGYGQSSDRAEALNVGFNAHLVKPVDLDLLSQLLQAVQKQLVAK